MTIEERLSALTAAPKPWVYVVRYEDGRERRIGALWQSAAENGAERERRKIGRDLIDRETGKTVRVIAVDVERNVA